MFQKTNILFSLFFPLFLIAAPAQIVIIRHGEKPASGNELNQRGCERAYSLPRFFLENPLINHYGTPVAIYAMAPHGENSSLRPIETIAPTAHALGLRVLNKYTKLQYQQIFDEVMNEANYEGKTIIFSWEHSAIPGLAQTFGLTLCGETKKWPSYVFDQAWVLNFTSKEVSLQIIPEDVLPGDNPLGGLTHWQDASKDTPSEPMLSDYAISSCQDNHLLNDIVEQVISEPLP